MDYRTEYRIEVEQDCIPVRGNALASGDAEADREAEDEILARLDRGDVWAWAAVTVIAEQDGFEGHDSLGGCSYASEADFKRSDYYADMRNVARENMLAKVATAVQDVNIYSRGAGFVGEGTGGGCMALVRYFGSIPDGPDVRDLGTITITNGDAHIPLSLDAEAIVCVNRPGAWTHGIDDHGDPLVRVTTLREALAWGSEQTSHAEALARVPASWTEAS